MLIAQQKKQENIAEYLLYMWQVEDLLRACQLDDQQIDQLLVGRFRAVEGITEPQLEQIRQWYIQLRDMMLTEGHRESGHLQITQNILIDLTDLHLHLLKQGQDAIYTSCFYSTLPYIVELRGKEGEEKVGELETCFTALYGLLLLRMQHKEVSEQTQVAMSQISKFLGLLSEKYKEWKADTLKFEDE